MLSWGKKNTKAPAGIVKEGLSLHVRRVPLPTLGAGSQGRGGGHGSRSLEGRGKGGG